MKFISINALYFAKIEPLKVVNINCVPQTVTDLDLKGRRVDFLSLYFTVIGSVLLHSFLGAVVMNFIGTTEKLDSFPPPCV